LSGGGGRDTASYLYSTTAVAVSLLSNRGVGGDADGDLLSGISNLRGASQALTILIGYHAANQLSGGTANDTLTGGLGADTLDGDAGNDMLIAGSGTALRDDPANMATANFLPLLNSAMSLSIRAQAAVGSDWHAVTLNAATGFSRTFEYGPTGLRFTQTINGIAETISANLTRDTDWHDINVSVSDSGSVEFYVDGIAFVASGGPLAASAPPASTSTLIIGNTNSQANSILYDQIMIYDRTLSATEAGPCKPDHTTTF